jgi:hypothetical protein
VCPGKPRNVAVICPGEFEVVILIETLTEEMHGSDQVADLKTITSEP